MSYKLEREKTVTSPYIIIDEDRGYMRFEGESYLENVIEYFQEVNDWLKTYLASDFESFTFDCAMWYFNSSTAKLIYNILRSLERASEAGKNITVNWIVTEGNVMMLETGEDFAEELEGLNFIIGGKEHV